MKPSVSELIKSSDVLDAHADAITRMIWFEDKRMLVTSSKDKTIRFWKLPTQWIKEPGSLSEKKNSAFDDDDEREKDIVGVEEREEKINYQQKPVVSNQLFNKNQLQEEDDDDLNGWSN